MKNHITLIVALVWSAISFSQNTPEWVVPAEDSYKMGIMMTTDADGNAIMVGDRPSYLGNAFTYIRKIDVNGNLLWEQLDSSGISFTWHKPRWVNTDAQNNIYVAGYQYVGTSDEYTYKIIALKYDEDGNLIWRKMIDHIWPFALPMRSCLDADNNFYIGTVSVDTGFTLIKLDTDGNLIFTSSDAGTSNQSFTSMRLKNNMVVMCSYGGNGTLACIVAFNTGGDFLWGQSFNSRGGLDVEIDDDMNVYLLSQEFDQVEEMSDMDIKLYKLNANGELLEEFNYDFGLSSDFANRMTLVNNKISIIGESIQNGGAYMDWITFQTDLNGNKLWDARYDYMLSNDEKPSWITAKENGEVYVSGQGGPEYVNLGSSYLRYVTLKYNGGDLVWVDANPYQGYVGVANALDNDCGLYALGQTSMTAMHYADSCGTVGLEDQLTNKNREELQVHPNPFANNATVNFYLNDTKSVSASIDDLLGRRVLVISNDQLLAGKNQLNLDLTDLNKGVYFFKLKTQNKTASIKLVKQ